MTIKTETVLLELFHDLLEELPTKAFGQKDPKTRLQEYLQSRQMQLPSYEVIQSSGKAHARTFTVRCFQADLDLDSRGTGSSRKQAEQEAAEQLLARIVS